VTRGKLTGFEMRVFLAVAIAFSGVAAAAPTKHESPAQPLKVATMCFKSGENAPPGSMTKVCFYDCLGSQVAITIPSTSLCPLSINR